MGFLFIYLNNCWARACGQSSQKTSTVSCWELNCFRRKQSLIMPDKKWKKAIVSTPMRKGSYRKVQWLLSQLQVISSLTEQSPGLLIQRCLQWQFPPLQPTFCIVIVYPNQFAFFCQKTLSIKKMVRLLSSISLLNTNV